ncbi:MAG: FKBP-type peptidyl-prolyl cis-trans isomerase [Schleiferiaceae bacterium]|nr:FKBP-type peptidyl-prolyl cis-trans isomerase [Schleiferiaceae bacterium]
MLFLRNNFFSFVCIFCLAACQMPTDKQDDARTLTPDDFQAVRESQISRNRDFLKKERESIEQYIADRNWEMERTGNGLYYQLDKKTGGQKPDFKSEVAVIVVSYLLDGTLIHPKDSSALRVSVGTDTRFEIGFHEGLQLMEEGSSAKFILPSHLAHGLAGDLGTVPPMSALVYEVSLIQIFK